jgi:hypothetical protein
MENGDTKVAIVRLDLVVDCKPLRRSIPSSLDENSTQTVTPNKPDWI